MKDQWACRNAVSSKCHREKARNREALRSDGRQTRTMNDEQATASHANQGFEVRGSLAVDKGRGVLRYEMAVAAPPAAVWEALTDPARLATWYGRVEGDLRLGGTYHALLFPSGWEGDGQVLTCEPARQLRTESGEPGEPTTIDDLELTLDSGGTTRLTLTRVRPSADMLDAYAVGTQLHLENLAAHLAGNEPIDPEPFWAALRPRYAALAAANTSAPDRSA
jgi:uncharacterized protein YndB with AHSA1/START domain